MQAKELNCKVDNGSEEEHVEFVVFERGGVSVGSEIRMPKADSGTAVASDCVKLSSFRARGSSTLMRPVVNEIS